MGFKMTIPLMKLSFNPSRQAGAKGNTAPVHAYVMEFMDERYSASKTLDKTRSYMNEYEAISTHGKIVADAIYDEFQDYCDEMVASGKKKPRADSVVAIGYIEKPPAEVVNSWNDAYRKKFFEDSEEVLEELGEEYPLLSFFKKENRRARSMHHDEEGDHRHNVGMTYNDDGILQGAKSVNQRMKTIINKEYPKRMRERGHDIEDVKLIYDPEEAAKLETQEEKDEYKEKCKAEKKARKTGGLSVNAYDEVMTEERLNEIAEGIDTLSSVAEEFQAIIAEQETQKSKNAEQLQASGEKIDELVQLIHDMQGESYTGPDGKIYAGIQAIQGKRDEELSRMKEALQEADALEAKNSAAKQRLQNTQDKEDKVMNNVKNALSLVAEWEQFASTIEDNLKTSNDMVQTWDAYSAVIHETGLYDKQSETDQAAFDAVQAARDNNPWAEMYEAVLELLRKLRQFKQRMQLMQASREHADTSTVDTFSGNQYEDAGFER